MRIKGAPGEEDASGAGDAVSLDLKIEGPRDIFVRGRGLDSEMSLRTGIQGIAGSTFTANAVTAAVRRALAIHEVSR